MASQLKVNKMADQLPKFKKILAELHKKEGARLAKKSEEEAKRLLGLTFTDAHIGFKRATVKTDKKITKTDKGCIVQMHFFVAEANTAKPHEVWHIVNRGREGGRIKSNIVFQPRRGTRTSRGSLHLKPFQGYEGDLVFRSKGTFLAGFEGRHFYDTAMDQLIFKLFAGGRFRDWEVNKKEVKDD